MASIYTISSEKKLFIYDMDNLIHLRIAFKEQLDRPIVLAGDYLSGLTSCIYKDTLYYAYINQSHDIIIKCILVCVYGNRAYEDTLVEMEDAAKECGFHVVAAISAVAEHSIMPQYAAGRPNESDRMQLEKFAKQILEKTDAVKNIPGNRPYKKAGGAGLVPKPAKNCVRCGLCVKNCPVQAIDPASFKADSKKCIACMRCVKECPENARKANGTMVAVASLALKKACTVPKKNELFL